MGNRKKSSLLCTLVGRGDQINIINGQLIIKPYRNKTVPGTWMTKNKTNLVREIASLLELDNIYTYESYSTGLYGKAKRGGVTLQFSNIATGKEAYVIFNAHLKQMRKSKNRNAGDLLPKGQFRVTKNQKFYQFWLSIGLKEPPRLASFYSYMGNLKKLLFSPEVNERGKVMNKLIPTLNVKHEEIIKCLNSKITNSSQTTYRQSADNSHTMTAYKEMPTPQVNKGIQRNLTTGLNECGISLHGNGNISVPVSTVKKKKRPQDQTTEEWLEDYGNP